MRFSGRRAFITGGTKGIGAAIAQRFASEGADVVVAARNPGEADGAVGRAVAVDVADPDATRAAVEETGPFDVIVSNAGVDDFGWFTEISAERWRRLIDVNLGGAISTLQAALPAMQQSRYGRVVIITSEAGRIGSKGNAVYAATKGALISLAKSLARENARYGITVNALAPGPIQTPMLEANRQLPRGEDIVAGMIGGTVLGRLGTPEEVAAAAAFLASEEASYITGETLGVSGGMGIGGG